MRISCGQLAIAPTLAKLVRHHPSHGFGKVGINDYAVTGVGTMCSVHFGWAFAIEVEAGYRFASPNLHSHLASNFSHALADLSASAVRMIDAVLIFKNERIENRLGHLKGDMPKYFD